MRDRDFEDEWEDIGRYLVRSGWDVEERVESDVMWGRDPQEEWSYDVGGDVDGFIVYGFPPGDHPPYADVEKGFHVRLVAPRGLVQQQQHYFFVALSDFFDDVELWAQGSRYEAPAEAMQRAALHPIELIFPTISSSPMAAGLGRGGHRLAGEPRRRVEGIVQGRTYSFWAPSAEDVIGIVEAFVLTQMEMRRA